MDGDSTNRKKKRGRSLIFRKVFRKTGSSDSGKNLASDDNLVYCDVTNNHVEPEIKKSTSARRQMSRIFKGVLFDAAMKKKMRRKKSTKKSNDSVDSSPEQDEEIDNSLNEDDSNVEEVLGTENSSDDSSNDDNSLSSKDDASESQTASSKDIAYETQIASSEISSIDPSSQILIERKATSRVNSMDKKPPHRNSQPSVKPIQPKDTKPNTLNDTTFPLYMFILIGIFVLVVMWMSYAVITAKSSNIESSHLLELPYIVNDADEL